MTRRAESAVSFEDYVARKRAGACIARLYAAAIEQQYYRLTMIAESQLRRGWQSGDEAAAIRR
jgi:hypothetical protein